MTAEPQPVDELEERRRIEAEAGPTITGVSDTFTFTCPCEATVLVAGGAELPHDCPLTEEQRQEIRDANAELDCTECVVTVNGLTPCDEHAEPDDGTVQVDPLAMSMQLLSEAFVEIRSREQRKVKVLLSDKIALGRALAANVQAHATRASASMQQQIATVQLADRDAAMRAQHEAAERAKGPAQIVVPQLNLGGR